MIVDVAQRPSDSPHSRIRRMIAPQGALAVPQVPLHFCHAHDPAPNVIQITKKWVKIRDLCTTAVTNFTKSARPG
jgi:hypothetical protein